MEVLLERHYAPVHTICRRILGRDADDATQETLIKVVRSLDRFDGRAKFSTWVYRIATNTALDEIRRRTRRPAVHLVETNEPPDVTATDAIDQIGDGLVLEAALAALPDDQRAAVVLRDVIGLDHAEIAEVLEIPIGTTKSRVARGRARLLEIVGSTDGSDTSGNRTGGARRHNPTQEPRP